MAPVRRLIIALVLAWLPAAPALSFLRPPDGSAADRAWARGPVWYIMTTAEYDLIGLHSLLRFAKLHIQFA